MTVKPMTSLKRQRGAALITVMLMSIVVIAILANIFYRHGIDVARAGKTLHGEQAALLTLSGESWAMQVLRQDYDDNPNSDHLDEAWAYGLPFLPVEGGTLTGQLEDLQSKISINSLASYNTPAKVNRASNVNSVPYNNSFYAVFLQLINKFDLPLYPNHLAVIIDWIDSNDTPLPGGAEENEYLIKEPAYRAANQHITELDELLLLEGFTPEVYAAILPFINALPAGQNKTPTINVNTADALVLQALHPDIDAAVAENLILARAQTPWDSIDDFYTEVAIQLNLNNGANDAKRMFTEGGPPPNNQQNSNQPANRRQGNAQQQGGGGNNPNAGSRQIVDVKTEYFLLTVAVQLGSNTVQLQSVLHRDGRNVLVLARTLRYLPNTLAEEPEGQQETT